MNTTPNAQHPTTLSATLAHHGLGDLLTGFIPRAHVTRRVSWSEFVRFVERQGYGIVKEYGNVYGRVGVRPAAPPTLAPVMRAITRSDHAATYGSKRRAA